MATPKALNNIPMVESFIVNDVNCTNLDKNWEIWKEDFKIFIAASGITNNEQKEALLLHVTGRYVKEIYRTLKDDADSMENIITKLDGYFKPRKNLTYERYQFKKAVQKESEDLNSYITRLRSLAATCEFTDKSVEIKDQFIVSCKSDSLRIKLLREKDITLEKLLEICRCEETAKRPAKDMKRKEEHDLDEEVSKVSQTNYFRYRNKPNRSNKLEKPKQSLCFKCCDRFYRGHMQSCKALGKK